jgi:hypothetical protein
MNKLMTAAASAIIFISMVSGYNSAQAAGTPGEGVHKEVAISFNDAYVPGGFDSASDVFVVANGIYPNGCYKWNKSDVKHLDGNVHEVSGTASVSQGMCLMVLVPFTKEIHLGQIGSGEHLIRLMNGDGTYLEKKLVIE